MRALRTEETAPKPKRRSPRGVTGRLRARLQELEETLRAIRSGEVDALVVQTGGGDQVFTLKSADQTYRLMVEEMQTGAATLSAEGVLLYCNPFLAALLGAPLEELLGSPLGRFLDERAAFAMSGLLVAAERGVTRSEMMFQGRGGAVSTHVSLTALSLEGAPVFSMIVTDLTERKLREEERAQLALERAGRAAAEEGGRAALEEIERRKRVEERLRHAETQRADVLKRERIARTEAEEANRLKDEFLATLSHELRSPLNAIVAWSHLLNHPGLDAVDARRASEAIERNARAQTRLVADILDVSQIVTGKFRLCLGPMRWAEVIESAVDTVRPAAQARGIQIELLVDALAGPVSGDSSRLQQVVWNLLANAVKFAPAGGQVKVRLEDRGDYVELSVADNGPGIDPEFLPHVFDRFRQADSSSTRRHGGLGLGLAIVRHLVELHGGTVEARNREGEPGAVLRMRLPRQPASSDETPADPNTVVETRQGPSALPATLQGISVLVVDDEEDACEAMAVGLGRLGARVATASSARQALDALLRDRPDVLVADIGMAGEDGYSLLGEVRALAAERGGGTPAIALTGYASPRDVAEALRAGFQVHLAKPVTSAELAVAVASLVSVSGRQILQAEP